MKLKKNLVTPKKEGEHAGVVVTDSEHAQKAKMATNSSLGRKNNDRGLAEN